MDILDRKQAIGLMLASFPASQSQGQLVALAYLMAVEDLSDFAINKAAREFIKGEVKDHDRRFAPSTAQFAAQAQMREIAERTVAYVAKHPELLEQTEYPEEYRTEMRKRVSALLMRLPGTRVMVGDRDGHEDAA